MDEKLLEAVEIEMDRTSLADILQEIAVRLNDEQLRSHCRALRRENNNRTGKIEDLNKAVGEWKLTAETLNRTIGEQSDTLNKREEILKEAEHDRDHALQRIDDLTEVHERVKADALALIQKGGDITPVIFAEALDVYALAVARISSIDAHPQIVVALVQMAMHIRGLETVADIIKWLRGSQ